jgi:hypothetical protein
MKKAITPSKVRESKLMAERNRLRKKKERAKITKIIREQLRTSKKMLNNKHLLPLEKAVIVSIIEMFTTLIIRRKNVL